MDHSVNIEGLSKAAVLAALYNASRPLGMGFLQYDSQPMTPEQAKEFLVPGQWTKRIYFDYLQGRVMKVDLTSDVEFDPRLYDRDNGLGAAQRVIDTLRETNDANDRTIDDMRRHGTYQSALHAMNHLHEESRVSTNGTLPIVHLGLADAKDKLEPRILSAIEENKPQ